MMILHICDNATVLSVMKLIKTVINIIKIVVPILLIISLMITYMRAVKDDDELAKYNKVAISKVIAALLIFFIPTFINIIANVASADKSYLNCIKNATDEGIANAYRNTARSYINRVKSSLTTSDYNSAVSYVNSIKDKDVKQDLIDELNDLKKYVDIKNEIDNISKSTDTNAIQKIKDKIASVPDGEIKDKLNELMDKKQISLQDNYNSDTMDSPSNGNVSQDSGGQSLNPKGMISFDTSNLSCPIYYYTDYYNNQVTKSNSILFHPDIGKELINILDSMCPYINSNPYIEFLQHAGFGVQRQGSDHDYHAKGLAFDLNNLWSYKDPNTGKTYMPYSSQGRYDWNTYVSFICEVCNGNENCEQNVNYQIYYRYFYGKGWCWGGNWSPDSFDPMHFEYRNPCYVGNKQKIVCE